MKLLHTSAAQISPAGPGFLPMHWRAPPGAARIKNYSLSVFFQIKGQEHRNQPYCSFVLQISFQRSTWQF